MRNFSRSFCFLFFLHTAFWAMGQLNLRGKVTDQQTGLEVPYVNIGVLGGLSGTVSDVDGFFNLLVATADTKITFSAIGYRTVTLSAQNIQQQTEIKLSPQAYALQTVEISARDFEESIVQYGMYNEQGRGHAVGFGSQELGTEFGTVIDIPDSTWLQRAHFVLVHAKGDSMHFRVKIYPYDPQADTLGPNLTPRSIIVSRAQSPGVFSVDLRPENMYVAGPVLLSLEWIRDDGNTGNQGITFDTIKNRKSMGTYWRFTSQAPMQKQKIKGNYHPCFYLTGKTTARKEPKE